MERDKESQSKDKVSRVLKLYSRMMEGQTIHKDTEASVYGVTKRSITRDIDDIQEFLKVNAAETGESRYVVYDKAKRSYHIDGGHSKLLTNAEILAICKVLLDCRTFSKAEMDSVLVKLIQCCMPKASRQQVLGLILSEEYHYVEPQLQHVFLDTMWNIGQAIQSYHVLEFEYLQMTDQSIVKRRIFPLTILFSDSYFYVTGFIEGEEFTQNTCVSRDAFPSIYRIDRIQNMKILDKQFRMPYRDRYEETEFRKQILFLYGTACQKA